MQTGQVYDTGTEHVDKGGGHAGPITMVATVALVTHSGRGRHLVLPRGVLGCRVLLHPVVVFTCTKETASATPSIPP